MKTEDQFWSSKTVSDKGCWEWTRSLRSNGYGQLRWKERANISAHRLSYILSKGPIPDGMLVCHTCDNRKCINPDHLFLGTYQDNHDDMILKGRKRWVARRGSMQGNSKLNEADVALIKRKLSEGEKGRHIAAKFGVSPSTISLIKLGKFWRHVDD